jgi:O-antigen ligase
MDAASRRMLAGVTVAGPAVACVLVGWAFFAGGASGTDATATLGTAAVLAAAALVVGWALGSVPLPRLDRAGAVAAGTAIALVGWTGLTIIWSIAGDRSWDTLAKGIAVLGFGVVGLAAAALPGRPLRTLALVIAALLGAVLGWALIGKAVPALGPDDADRVARLKGSIGYWNALALLADASLGIGLWLAVSLRERLARPAGALLFYLAVVVVLLTQSRAGLVAGLVVLGVALVLGERRVEAALLALLAGGPAILVSAWAFTRPALVEDGAARSDRVSDGGVLGVLLVLGAAAAVALVVLVPVARLVATRRRAVVRALVGAATLVAVVGVVGLVASVGNPFTWAREQVSRSTEVANAPGRLGSLETNNRTAWWGEAWHVFRAHPLGGAGAGTFEIARKRYRADARNVSEPHSVPMQLLSDGGLPALALGIAFVAALVLALRATLTRLTGGERAAAVGLLALPIAFGLHSLVDYDLDFLAVAAPTALVAAALLGAGRPAAIARSRVVVVGSAVLTGAVAVWVLAAPALSGRAVDRSYRQADAGDLSAAAASARRAQSLDPLSPDPLYARATVASLQGDRRAAERFYEQATELQPENPDTWYQLGLFRQLALEDQCGAYFALNAAYTLDPRSTLFPPGGPLDLAKAAVNDPDDPACGR